MKVLLDENLPRQMRVELAGHDVYTTPYLGWAGVKNGELLRRAAVAGFEVFISLDQGLEYQQNQAQLPLAVIVLRLPDNTIESVRTIYSQLLSELARLQPRTLLKIEQP